MLNFNETEINICNIYLCDQHTFLEKYFENIIKQLLKPFITTGDFNSHDIIWRSQKTDNKGRKMKRILENENLVLLKSWKSIHVILPTTISLTLT